MVLPGQHEAEAVGARDCCGLLEVAEALQFQAQKGPHCLERHRGREGPHSPAPSAGQEGPHSQHPEVGPLGVQKVDLEHSVAQGAQPVQAPSVPAEARLALLLTHVQQRKHAAPSGE